MSSTDHSPRTTVVYSAEGGSTEYVGLEVDEVDAIGALRLARYDSRTDELNTAGPVYVVWAPGTWSRVETKIAG